MVIWSYFLLVLFCIICTSVLFYDQIYLCNLSISNIKFSSNQLWYPLSKTLAEECAWKFSKDTGIEIVAINPSMVLDPLQEPTLNTSAAIILNLINDTCFMVISLGVKTNNYFSFEVNF